jgi:spermidine/putrescine transport system ATP-binding protein
VRPEKIRISLRAAERVAGDNAIEGRVRDATFVGVSNVYTVETRDGHVVTVYAQNLGTSGDPPPGPGEAVTLTWHPEHTFVVAAQEGGTDGE